MVKIMMMMRMIDMIMMKIVMKIMMKIVMKIVMNIVMKIVIIIINADDGDDGVTCRLPSQLRPRTGLGKLPERKTVQTRLESSSSS